MNIRSTNSKFQLGTNVITTARREKHQFSLHSQTQKMFIIERLRPFVLVCQIFGLFPFYMENDPLTRNFKSFSFSLRKPVTWWFFCLLVLQFVFLILDVEAVWTTHLQEGILKYKVPPIFGVFIFLQCLFFHILVSITRYVIFKYIHIRRAIHLIRKVHTELETESQPEENMPKVTRRVVLCLIFAFICVSMRPTDNLIQNDLPIFN